MVNEGGAKPELTFSPVQFNFPSATWREILAAKIDKTVMGLFAVFWLVLLLLLYCIRGYPSEVPGKIDCCESLSTKFELLLQELKDQPLHPNKEGYVNEMNLANTSIPKVVNIPDVAVVKPEKTPASCAPSRKNDLTAGSKELKDQHFHLNREGYVVNHEKTRFAPPRKIKSPSLTSDLKAGSKEGLAREPEYVINENMSANLVDWLIEVHHKFELRQETLYLTINIVNEFLSMKEVPRKELQLVGIATMLIACRYEEVLAPEVNDLLQISEEAYEREQVFAMEKAILGKLLRYWTVPTPYMLHTRYVKAYVPVDFESLQTEKMVCFLAELGMMNYFDTIKYPPSLLTASSVYDCYSSAPELKHYDCYSPAPGLKH